MPRYTYTMDKNQLFINPYNFVPVNLKQTKRSDITLEKEQLLTGYFECRMKCRTPLAVPDTARKQPLNTGNGEEHFAYPFFTVDGIHPVIPGSTIRGVVRNVYETLTDSCFGTMKKDTKITIRSLDPFKPGLLKRRADGSWELYDAERYLIVVDKKFYDTQEEAREYGVKPHSEQKLRKLFRSGDPVRYQVIRDGMRGLAGYTTRSGYTIGKYANLVPDKNRGVEGYICFGEKAPKRHFQSVFKEGKLLRKIQPEDISRLEAVLAAYRDETINRHYTTGWYDDYEYAKEKGVIPVYHSLKEGKKEPLYMSFAALGRKAFKETLNSKAGEKAHEKCDSRKNLCPACTLFGTIEGEGVGSRVRFTDAECPGFKQEQLIKKVTFEELGSPRISYLPFYLREQGSATRYQEGYDSPGLMLRGRKFYWHHVPDTGKKVKKHLRNATFDLINTGSEFCFRVYFDGVTEEQMSILAAALHLNENSIDGKYCHKLGHGKPLGYGSVKISIEDCVIRECCSEDADGGKLSRKETHRAVPCSDDNYRCGGNTYQALRTICDFQPAASRKNAEVCYPGVVPSPQLEARKEQLKENDLASHKWFSENYKLNNKQPKRPLPEILDKDVTLAKCILDNSGEDTRGNGYRGYGKDGKRQGGGQNHHSDYNNRNRKR